jgi:hypothetical protein
LNLADEQGMKCPWLRLGGVAVLVWGSAGGSALAQFSIEGRPLQVHGFFTQGFLYSNQNNYLTANTTSGSLAFTDGGLNVSMQITPKFRVGAQGYVRNLGSLGQGHLTLDWGLGDYRFSEKIGIRVGRVKTAMGLYNDTQDMEFLHTWALLPQSLYPIDIRGFNISHTGGDVYGTLRKRGLGRFAYTAYAGYAPGDRAGGVQYGLETYGIQIGRRNGHMAGVDLKWTTPVDGLLLGSTYLNTWERLKGSTSTYNAKFSSHTPYHALVFSAQYTRGPWRIEWERTRTTLISSTDSEIPGYGSLHVDVPYDIRGWYAATAYRLTRFLEIGTYHSRIYPNSDQQIPALDRQLSWPERHIFDQAVTARFDIRSFWDLKVEGHFMDGYGDPGTARGFYPQDNPLGLQPKTNLLIIRMGFNR